GQQVGREASPVGGHEVAGGDGADGYDVGVGAVVAHDADTLGVGEYGEGLTEFAVDACSLDFFDDDFIGGAQDGEFFFVDGADDADGEAGSGERVTPDPIGG